MCPKEKSMKRTAMLFIALMLEPSYLSFSSEKNSLLSGKSQSYYCHAHTLIHTINRTEEEEDSIAITTYTESKKFIHGQKTTRYQLTTITHSIDTDSKQENYSGSRITNCLERHQKPESLQDPAKKFAQLEQQWELFRTQTIKQKESSQTCSVS